MAASRNTLFDQAYKKYCEKEKKQNKRLDFQSEDTSIKSATLLSFYEVARPQMVLILNNYCYTIQLINY